MTRNLIDAKRLAVMKQGAVLNFARDALVDDAAVVAALRAATQVLHVRFPGRVAHEPGVVALPHLGASTEEAEENCAVMVVDQVREFLEHGAIANAVNFPNVEMPRESPYRLAIANANVPNMLGQISTAMARAGLNIHNMVNKSRGRWPTRSSMSTARSAGRDSSHRGHRRRSLGAGIPAVDAG